MEKNIVNRYTNLKGVCYLVAALLAVLLLAFFFSKKGYLDRPSYLSGDEPHYIMMTDSLVRDCDFNLRNDYELGRALEYYPVPGLYPHLSSVIDPAEDGWYSIHTVGLPLILYAPYKLLGLVGARVWMILLQFSAVIIFSLILKKYLALQRQRLVGVILLLICPLFWQNLGGIFPDMLIMNIWGLLILLFGRRDQSSNTAIMGLVLLGTLLHSKGLILTAPLVLFHVLWLVRDSGVMGWVKKYWVGPALLSVGALSYIYFLYRSYGVWNPAQLYSGNEGGSQLFSANPSLNLIALLTDRSKGLLVHFPLLLTAGLYVFAAVSALVRTAKKVVGKKTKLVLKHYLLAGLTAGTLATLVTVLTFNDWSGSCAPNGRTVLPFVLLTIFIIASFANFRSRFEVVVLLSLGLLSAWLSWLSISDFKYYMSPGANSFWVDRFPPLNNLPIFSLVVQAHESGYAIRGAKILVLLLAANIVLGVLYSYPVSIKKRT